jgi:hypothetical protein
MAGSRESRASYEVGGPRSKQCYRLGKRSARSSTARRRDVGIEEDKEEEEKEKEGERGRRGGALAIARVKRSFLAKKAVDLDRLSATLSAP